MQFIEMSPQGRLDFPEFESLGITGRKKDLKFLDTLIQGKRDHPNQVTVIRGMAGEGKTYLALAYCDKVSKGNTFKTVFWIDTTDPARCHQSWENVCNTLNVEKEQPTSNEEELALERDKRMRRGVSALHALREPWLLVLDGVDFPESKPWTMEILESFKQTYGAVLITTRCMNDDFLPACTASPFAADFMTLKPMAEDFLLDMFFSGLSKYEEWDREENELAAFRIMDAFGHHIWAITQACQFIRICNIADLSQFECHRRVQMWFELSLLRGSQSSSTDMTGHGLDDCVSISLCDTFDKCLSDMLSLKFSGAAEELENGAFLLLSFLSLFGRSALSKQLIIAAIYTKIDTPYVFPWAPLCMDGNNYDDAKFRYLLEQLCHCSLVQVSEKSENSMGIDLFSIHPVVREWLRMKLEEDDRSMLVTLALETIDSMVSRRINGDLDPAGRIFINETIPEHVDAMLNISPTSLRDISTHVSPETFCAFLGIDRNYFEGNMYERMLQKFHWIEDHGPFKYAYFERVHFRYVVLWVLAWCYSEAKMYNLAEHLWFQAEDEAIATYGPDSPEANGCLASRGMLYYARGDPIGCALQLQTALDRLVPPLEVGGQPDFYIRIAGALADLYYQETDEVTNKQAIASHLGSAFAFARGLLRFQLSGGFPNTEEVLRWVCRLQDIYAKTKEHAENFAGNHREPCVLSWLYRTFCSIQRAESTDWIHAQIMKEKEADDLFWTADLVDRFKLLMGKRHPLERRSELDSLLPLVIEEENDRAEWEFEETGEEECDEEEVWERISVLRVPERRFGSNWLRPGREVHQWIFW